MAERTLIVRVIGDDRSMQQAFARDQKAVAAFGTTSTKSLGKVDAAFSRTQRIAAGGFLGGVAVTAGLSALRSVVSAAQDSEESLGQTRVALESTGKSWADYGQQIESAIKSQSKLGFDDEDLLRTFSLFVRQTKNVGQAVRENNIAMDVARARFISLDQAAQIVNKAALGNAGALRRIGIDAQKGATGVELLAQLEREFGGAAEDASTRSTAAMDRLHVSLENIQETIGSALLPVIAKFASSLSDTAETVDSVAQGLTRLGKVRIPEVHIPFVADFGGGRVSGALGKVFDVAKFLGPFQIPTVTNKIVHAIANKFKTTTQQSTPELAKSFEDSLNAMFTNALDTAGKNVKPPGEVLTPAIQFDQLPGVKPDFASGIVGPLNEAIAKAKKQAEDAIKAGNAAIAKDTAAKAAQGRKDAFSKLIDALQLNVDRAGLTKGLNDDLAALQDLKKGLLRQVKAGVDVASAQSELVRVTADIAAKQAEIRQKTADALQARQFKALGLSGEGGDLVPGVANLKKQLAQLAGNLGADATPKIESQLSRVGKVLAGKFGEVTVETRAKIKELFQTIRGELGKGADSLNKAGGPLTKTSSLNASKLLDGLGLGRDMEKELRARLSGFNSAGRGLAGKAPSAATGSFAAQQTVVQSNVTVTLDGEVVGRSVTRSQQKARRRNPPQRRGI